MNRNHFLFGDQLRRYQTGKKKYHESIEYFPMHKSYATMTKEDKVRIGEVNITANICVWNRTRRWVSIYRLEFPGKSVSGKIEKRIKHEFGFVQVSCSESYYSLCVLWFQHPHTNHNCTLYMKFTRFHQQPIAYNRKSNRNRHDISRDTSK